MNTQQVLDGLRDWAHRGSTNPEIVELLMGAASEIERLASHLKEAFGDWASDDTAIRDAAKRVLPEPQVDGDTWHVPHMTDVCELLVAEAERLREERRWRSTKTEPPSDEQWQVLIYDGRNVDIGDKLDGIGWTHEFGTLEWEAVTHWQPLPAPPAKEQ